MDREPPEFIVRQSEQIVLGLEELASAAGLHPDLVVQFVEYGLVEPLPGADPGPMFPVSAVDRLRRIVRLRSELGVNLAGIAVILDLRDRLLRLQEELERLREGEDADE
jgi:DNA-binding transcriptional MerR regulator